MQKSSDTFPRWVGLCFLGQQILLNYLTISRLELPAKSTKEKSSTSFCKACRDKKSQWNSWTNHLGIHQLLLNIFKPISRTGGRKRPCQISVFSWIAAIRIHFLIWNRSETFGELKNRLTKQRGRNPYELKMGLRIQVERSILNIHSQDSGIAEKPCKHNLQIEDLKSKFWYRYRPESIFRFFLAWFFTPSPGTHASTAKKGKFIGTGHFFRIAWPF